ncbi:helix-turn-helix domain-containing protein [Terrilactibacillus sp. S3-3]|nr:helix-turn-helix domain-containing protein [Terrilactibacillus sp. S3-3]
MDEIKRCLQWTAQDIFSELDSGRFVVLKTLKEGKEPEELKNNLGKKLENLNRLLFKKYRVTVSFAVGSIQNGAAGIRRSYQDAVHAMEAGKRSRLLSPYFYDDLAIKVDLMATGFTPYTKTRLQEMSKVFFAHDHDRTLSATFMTYCECNMNISETARKLFLHRNSLVYRLEKISALTSLDTSNFEQCLLLYVAIKNDSSFDKMNRPRFH